MNPTLCKILRSLTAPLRLWPAPVAAMTVILAAIPLVMQLGLGNDMKKLALTAICQGFVYAWAFGFIPVIWRRRAVAAVLPAAVALIMWLLCLPLIFSGKTFSPEVLQLMLDTDAREASSFLSVAATPRAVIMAATLLIIFAALTVGAICGNDRLRAILGRLRRLRRGLALTCAAMWVVGVAHLAYLYSNFLFTDLRRFEDWTIRQSRLVPTLFNSDEAAYADGVTASLFTLRGLQLNTAGMPLWEATQRRVLDEAIPRATEADSVNVVVIIGESFIKHHSPLYGYPLPTTPRLCAEADSGRLVAMTDYISPANITSAALRNLMNLNSVGDGERWTEAPFFPLVAARAGWRVRLFDNQVTAPRYLVDIQVAALMRNPLLYDNCYALTNDSIYPFDGQFLDMVDSLAPPDTTVGNLDIYHLYGQHFAPAERYPDDGSWDYFNADSIPFSRPWLTNEKKQYVAEYDNATRYNDYIIGRIIDRYAGAPTVFLYFSDHGEEMYDASDCALRNEPSGDLAGWLRRQFEIPFFVIANDAYRALRPGRWQRIADAASRPGMLDNIGQAVLGLAGVASEHYRPDRDIFAPEYRCPKRITVSRRLDFDSVVARINPSTSILQK